MSPISDRIDAAAALIAAFAVAFAEKAKGARRAAMLAWVGACHRRSSVLLNGNDPTGTRIRPDLA